ncbi:MAG: hypothetical protein HKN51_06050 [Saprospiraceae bacterium]|nr:hypothetical protein [Saprospiraceae bacterium]
MKKFSFISFGLSIFLIVGILSMNYFVDAYGIFRPDTNKAYDVTGFLRNVKPFWFKKLNYEGFIIGTSRAHNGFDPDGIEKITNTKYFNYGQSALSHTGAKHLVLFAENEGINKYIILLDAFLLPNNSRNYPDVKPNWVPDYEDEEKNKKYYSKEILPKVFSVPAFTKSLRKIFNMQNDATWKPNGLNLHGYESFQGGKRLWAPMRANLRKGKNRSFNKSKVNAFENAIDALCEDPSNEVILILPPVSMFYYTAIDYQSPGVNNEFREHVTTYINELPDSCKSNFQLYDFMYPNYITTERIDKNISSQYYRDPAHFRATTGNMIIQEIEDYKNGKLNKKAALVDLIGKNYRQLIRKQNRLCQIWIDSIGNPKLESFGLLDNIQKIQNNESETSSEDDEE